MKHDPKKLGDAGVLTANDDTRPNKRKAKPEAVQGAWGSAMVVNNTEAVCQARRTRVSHTHVPGSLSPYNNPRNRCSRGCFSFKRKEQRASERFGNLPKVAQLYSNRCGIQTQALCHIQ